jgi:hypothetical protein
MTPEALRKAAIELCGERGWARRLASYLNIDRTTVYRYVRGQLPIPGPVEEAVKCWLRLRSKPNDSAYANENKERNSG